MIEIALMAALSVQAAEAPEDMRRDLEDMRRQIDRMLRELERQGLIDEKKQVPKAVRPPMEPPEEETIGPEAPQPRVGRRVPGALPGGSLGIRIRAVDPTLRSHLRLSENQGAVVEAVAERSAAKDGGLETHDVILTFGETEIAGPEPLDVLIRAVAAAPRGRPIALAVIRAGERREITVTIQLKKGSYSPREPSSRKS
jgi:S1-C subfamily serine protease